MFKFSFRQIFRSRKSANEDTTAANSATTGKLEQSIEPQTVPERRPPQEPLITEEVAAIEAVPNPKDAKMTADTPLVESSEAVPHLPGDGEIVVDARSDGEVEAAPYLSIETYTSREHAAYNQRAQEQIDAARDLEQERLRQAREERQKRKDAAKMQTEDGSAFPQRW